ncbi:MAG: hypothetical protein AABY22_13345, partial [Nanoarchaeota archaeon]
LGNWQNWTKKTYDLIKKKDVYDTLDKGIYYCQERNEFENCKEIEGTSCFVGKVEIPRRYKFKVDDCYYLNNELVSNTIYYYNIEIKTFQPTENDFVKFILIDEDKRLINNKIAFAFDEDNEDIGIEDRLYLLNIKND